jgi:hypothetical protein
MSVVLLAINHSSFGIRVLLSGFLLCAPIFRSTEGADYQREARKQQGESQEETPVVVGPREQPCAALPCFAGPKVDCVQRMKCKGER